MHPKEYYTARKKTPYKMGKSQEYDAEQRKPGANERILRGAIYILPRCSLSVLRQGEECWVCL